MKRKNLPRSSNVYHDNGDGSGNSSPSLSLVDIHWESTAVPVMPSLLSDNIQHEGLSTDNACGPWRDRNGHRRLTQSHGTNVPRGPMASSTILLPVPKLHGVTVDSSPTPPLEAASRQEKGANFRFIIDEPDSTDDFGNPPIRLKMKPLRPGFDILSNETCSTQPVKNSTFCNDESPTSVALTVEEADAIVFDTPRNQRMPAFPGLGSPKVDGRYVSASSDDDNDNLILNLNS